MPTPSRKPRVCVIGAGVSGLVSLKALSEANAECVCFEASDRVGGLWAFGNRNGNSAAYRSLFINTSRDRMQLRDFPMPSDYPDYPHHQLIFTYLSSYAERFGLAGFTRLNTRVEQVTPATGGGYEVRFSTTQSNTAQATCTEHFDAVVVANGHHFEPSFPSPAAAGQFSGSILHAHAYVDPSDPCDLKGRRVIVVGFGNSAVDIACELAREPESRVYLSVRRGAWVLPRYALGRPLDQVSAAPGVGRWMPRAWTQKLAELWYRVAVGDVTRFGLPRPDHGLGDAHPTMSDELLPALGKGRILPKPQITRLDGQSVTFSDGSRAEADAIVYATGYRVVFPFFDPLFLSAPDNELPLYRHIFPPRIPSLYFVGLCQPLGPIMPLAEAQAKLIARHVTGNYELPDPVEMERAIASERASMLRRYGRSPRHTMQVDFDAYLASLQRELRRASRSDAGPGGARRAS